MRKRLTKSIALAMVLMTAFVMLFATTAFADGNGVHGEFEMKKLGRFGKVTGTMYLSSIASNPQVKATDEAGVYEGSLKAQVNTRELFADAYDFYSNTVVKEFKNAPYIVMYNTADKGYPCCTYTITVPDNIELDKKAVSIKNNSASISSISTDNALDDVHSIKITFKLGTWNDYGGFFKLVQSDNESSFITVDIPFKLKDDGSASWKVKGRGECRLSRVKWNIGVNIVDISSNEEWDITKGDEQ